MNRWAYELSLRRGYLETVEPFCAQPHVVDASRRAESWFATQSRESLMCACLDAAARAALAEQLAHAGCRDVWFLSRDGEIVLGPFVDPNGAFCVTAWLLRGGGGLLLTDETPLTTRWMLSVLAVHTAEKGHVDALELLLSSSIFRQGYTKEEYQCLLDQIARAWASSKVSERAVDMANVLLAHGCSVQSLHGAGDVGSDDVNRVLVDHGTYLYGVGTNYNGSVHPTYLRAMVEAGAEPHALPWHHIFLSGTVEAARLLVTNWCLDVDARLAAERDCTPLMFAVVGNDVSKVVMLLDHGADHARTDAVGWTALTVAAMVGVESVMESLLSRGADPNHVDYDGRSVLDHAMERPVRGPRMVKLLRQYGAC